MFRYVALLINIIDWLFPFCSIWIPDINGLPPKKDYTVMYGHSGPVYGASFSPDNQFLLTCSEDKTGISICIPICFSSLLFKLSIFPSGLMISFSSSSLARLWNMETRSNVVSYKGHNYPVWDVEFSPLGYYFATASHDRTAKLWSTDHIFPLRVFAGHLSDVNVCSVLFLLSSFSFSIFHTIYHLSFYLFTHSVFWIYISIVH